MIEITDAGYAISLISMGLAVTSALVRKAVTDQEKIKETKDRIKKHQEDMKKATKAGDTKKLQRVQQDMLALTMENLKHNMRPMLITFIPFILVFMWVRDQYSPVGTVASIAGFSLDWFWWYFICAMLVSLIVNKILKVN